MKAGERCIIREPLTVTDPDVFGDGAAVETEIPGGCELPALYTERLTPIEGDSIELWGVVPADGGPVEHPVRERKHAMDYAVYYPERNYRVVPLIAYVVAQPKE